VDGVLRKLRGMIGMAAFWGAGWFLLGAAFWTWRLFGQVPLDVILGVAGGVGIAGAIAGAGFATLLGLVEGKRSFEQLSYRRFAMLGAIGGLLVGLPFVAEIAVGGLGWFLALLAGLGAGSAVGTLTVARGAGGEEHFIGADHAALPPGLV